MKNVDIEQVCVVTTDADQFAAVDAADVAQGSPRSPSAEPKSALNKCCAAHLGKPSDLTREFVDVYDDKDPAELQIDRGVPHEIDLVSGSKY